MSSAATIRYLKARLKAMQESMDTLIADRGDNERDLNSNNSVIKKLTDERHKLKKQHSNLQSETERQRRLLDKANAKIATLETEVTNYRREVSDIAKERKKTEGDGQSKDVRLNRALAEVDKYRTLYEQAKADKRDASSSKQMSKLRAEKKKLEQQKGELISAFKKQMKLIDILKRQKMHVEAAKLLSFTEDDFSKTL